MTIIQAEPFVAPETGAAVQRTSRFDFQGTWRPSFEATNSGPFVILPVATHVDDAFTRTMAYAISRYDEDFRRLAE